MEEKVADTHSCIQRLNLEKGCCIDRCHKKTKLSNEYLGKYWQKELQTDDIPKFSIRRNKPNSVQG